MRFNKTIFIAIIITLLIAVASPILVLAADSGSVMDDINANLKGLGAGAGYQSSSESGNLPAIVGRIINVFLSILGVLFVILMVYGGYVWMTSFGNEQKVTRAKELIVDAIIGLIIILGAYAISSFVVGQLMKATTT